MTSPAPTDTTIPNEKEQRKSQIVEEITMLRSKTYQDLSTTHTEYLRELEFEASSKGIKV